MRLSIAMGLPPWLWMVHGKSHLEMDDLGPHDYGHLHLLGFSGCHRVSQWGGRSHFGGTLAEMGVIKPCCAGLKTGRPGGFASGGWKWMEIGFLMDFLTSNKCWNWIKQRSQSLKCVDNKDMDSLCNKQWIQPQHGKETTKMRNWTKSRDGKGLRLGVSHAITIYYQ